MKQYYYDLCSVKCSVPDSGYQGPWFEILKKRKNWVLKFWTVDLGDPNQVLYTLRYREHNNIAS